MLCLVRQIEYRFHRSMWGAHCKVTKYWWNENDKFWKQWTKIDEAANNLHTSDENYIYNWHPIKS